MKYLFILIILILKSFYLYATPISDNIRDHIYSSQLLPYHSNLSDQESEQLILRQFQIVQECVLGEGYCEHALYSLKTSAEIAIRQNDSVANQQMLLFLQDAYAELEDEQSYLTVFEVMIGFVQPRVESLRQHLLETVLTQHAQATPIEFVGSYSLLLHAVTNGSIQSFYPSQSDEVIDVDNPITEAYLNLLKAVLTKHNEKSDFSHQMDGLMATSFSSMVNREGYIPRCQHCTTKFIVEHYNDRSRDKLYDEVDVTSFIAKKTLRNTKFDNYRIAFPHYYVSEVVPFLLGLKTYAHKNVAKFLRNNNNLGSIDETQRTLILKEVREAIKKKGIELSFSSILNMTFRYLTATGQIESILSSGVKLSALRSNQLNAGSHNKIFAVNIFTNVVLKKMPRVLTGEVLRFGCGRDQWRLPAALYMLLEDKCVFTPSFSLGSFSITASTTFSSQDQYDYQFSVYHKPTNTTLLTKSISSKQEIIFYRSALGAFSPEDLILYISNTNPEVRSDIAAIQISNKLFKYGYGGVIKNNTVYFVKKLLTPEFNRFRAEEFGCTLVSRTEEQQIDCLQTKLETYDLPDYFYKNMESIGPVPHDTQTTLEDVIEAEDNRQKEAEKKVIEQSIANALSGHGWGPSGGLYGL